MKKNYTFYLDKTLVEQVRLMSKDSKRSLNTMIEILLEKSLPAGIIIQNDIHDVVRPNIRDVMIDEAGTIPDAYEPIIQPNYEFEQPKNSIDDDIVLLQQKIEKEKQVMNTTTGTVKIEAQVRKIALEKELAKKLKEKRISA